MYHSPLTCLPYALHSWSKLENPPPTPFDWFLGPRKAGQCPAFGDGLIVLKKTINKGNFWVRIHYRKIKRCYHILSLWWKPKTSLKAGNKNSLTHPSLVFTLFDISWKKITFFLKRFLIQFQQNPGFFFYTPSIGWSGQQCPSNNVFSYSSRALFPKRRRNPRFDTFSSTFAHHHVFSSKKTIKSRKVKGGKVSRDLR